MLRTGHEVHTWGDRGLGVPIYTEGSVVDMHLPLRVASVGCKRETKAKRLFRDKPILFFLLELSPLMNRSKQTKTRSWSCPTNDHV